jgi:hypothetical protein
VLPNSAHLPMRLLTAAKGCADPRWARSTGADRATKGHQGCQTWHSAAERSAANRSPTFQCAPGTISWLPQARPERAPDQDTHRRSESSRATRVRASFNTVPTYGRKEGEGVGARDSIEGAVAIQSLTRGDSSVALCPVYRFPHVLLFPSPLVELIIYSKIGNLSMSSG